MEVSSTNLKFRIELVELNSLKPHEEVITQLVRKLSNEIESEGQVHDPLIIDDKGFVVLDGMHRCESLKDLKCRFAPCCLLDYDNPKIGVESWFRTVKVEAPENFARKILTEAGVGYVESRIALDKIESDLALVVTKGGFSFNPASPISDLEHARTAVRLEALGSKKGRQIEYHHCRIAVEKLRSSQVDMIIPVPTFTKQKIRELGVEGKLLPHKVTCHVIPSRPLRLDVPLTLLRDRSLDVSKANEELTRILSTRRIEMRPPGSVVNGRRYAEELLVFD